MFLLIQLLFVPQTTGALLTVHAHCHSNFQLLLTINWSQNLNQTIIALWHFGNIKFIH